MPRKRTRKRSGGKKSANYTYGTPSGNARSSVGNYSSVQRSESIGRVHRTLVGITNPFSDASRGSRIPDDDAAPSIPITMKAAVSFNPTQGPNGDQIAVLVQPGLDLTYRQSATFNALKDTEVATWDVWQALGDAPAVIANAKQWRLVSMGVRFYSSAPPTAQGGVVRVVTSPMNPGSNVDIAGGFWQSVDNFAISQSDVHVVLKPQGTTWKEYNETNVIADYDKVIFLVQGASSVHKVHVEITMNMEILPLIGSITGSLAKPGEPSNPHVLQAASRVHSGHDGIHKSAPSMFSKLGSLAKNALIDVASSAIPFVGNALGNYFKRPSASSYPMIVD